MTPQAINQRNFLSRLSKRSTEISGNGKLLGVKSSDLFVVTPSGGPALLAQFRLKAGLQTKPVKSELKVL